MSSPVLFDSSTKTGSSAPPSQRQPPYRNGRKGAPRDVDVHVGKMIRSRRLMLGWSQSDLAKKLGVAFQQVQKYEKGGNRVSASRLVDIADALAMPVSDLFPDRAQTHPKLSDTVDTPAAVRLLRAFSGVRSARRRAAIVALVESVSGPVDKQ